MITSHHIRHPSVKNGMRFEYVVISAKKKKKNKKDFWVQGVTQQNNLRQTLVYSF